MQLNLTRRDTGNGMLNLKREKGGCDNIFQVPEGMSSKKRCVFFFFKKSPLQKQNKLQEGKFWQNVRTNFMVLPLSMNMFMWILGNHLPRII